MEVLIGAPVLTLLVGHQHSATVGLHPKWLPEAPVLPLSFLLGGGCSSVLELVFLHTEGPRFNFLMSPGWEKECCWCEFPESSCQALQRRQETGFECAGSRSTGSTNGINQNRSARDQWGSCPHWGVHTGLQTLAVPHPTSCHLLTPYHLLLE